MNPKLALVFLFVACASAASEFPAGLHPSLCPNYPHCDNELLARYHADGQPKHIVLGSPLAYAAPIPAVRAAEYPAGVPASACPNYPFCNVHVSAEPLPGYSQRLYPADVPAAACPGYPYC